MGIVVHFLKNKASQIVFILTCIVFFHQGCGKVGFKSVIDPAQKMSGNGSGYGGKLTYNHLVPDFTCEGKAAHRASLEIDGANATWTENNFNKCNSVSLSVPVADIDRSNRQADVVGYKEMILEQQTTQVADVSLTVPSTLVEAWCQEQQSPYRFEILAYYDRIDQKAHLRVISQDGAGQIQDDPAVSVARTISANAVQYASSTSDLKIDKLKAGTKAGLYQGTLKIKLQANDVVTPVECRFGGLLDARLWPSKLVADGNVVQHQFLKSSEQLVYVDQKLSATNQPQNSMYVLDLKSETSKLISQPTTNYGVEDFKVNASESNILFRSRGNISIELFVIRPNGTGLSQLSQPLTTAYQFVEPDYRFSADEQSVFYRDGFQEPGNDVEKWLRSVSVNGGTVQQINPNMDLNGDVGVYAHATSKLNQSTVYLAGELYPRIYSYNPISRATTDVTPTLATGWVFNWFSELLIPKSARWVFISAINQNAVLSPTPLLGTLFAIASDGSDTRDLQINTSNFSLSPEQNWIVVEPHVRTTTQDKFSSNETIFTQTESLRKFSYNFGSNLNWKFIKSENLIFTGIGQGQSKIINPITGVTETICSSISGTIKSVVDSADQQFLFIASESVDHSRHLWKYDFATSRCLKINSYLGSGAPNLKLIVSKNNKFVVIKESGLGKNIYAPDAGQLYLVPTDGKPTIQINVPAFPVIENVNDFEFINTDSQVLFQTQSTFTDAQLYIWTIPEKLLSN